MMKNLFLRVLTGGLALIFAANGCPAAQWVSSTAAHPWREEPLAAEKADAVSGRGAVPDPWVQFQVVDGFGGCFNELGWDALQAVDEGSRREVLRALFDSDGCAFTLCRAPMGANDFARDWYSYDETAGDLAMSHFSIDHDRTTLLPYMKAAMEYAPRLAVWSVPWSPPSWMKTNWSYTPGRMRQDPELLAAYALYFSKYVQAYRQAGIDLYAVQPQNEPATADGAYPICMWNGEELKTFVRDYLAPRLKQDHVRVEIWLGTLNDARMADFTDPFLGDPEVNGLIAGVGYQYEGRSAFGPTHSKYPEKRLMQTEAECHHGDNTWSEGLETFRHICDDLNHFADAYMYWNLILDEKKISTWGWRQNSMVTIDGRTKKVAFNPEFYAMKHFSHFVRPGAVRIKFTDSPFPDAVAFRNPLGEIVVAFANETSEKVPLTLRFRGSVFRLTVPARSMNTVTLPNE